MGDLAIFHIVPDEPCAGLMRRLTTWMAENREVILALASTYRDYSCCNEADDFHSQALLAGYDTVQVAAKKGTPQQFPGIFNEIFRSQLYRTTPKKVFERPEAAPLITAHLGSERSAASWDAASDELVHEPVDDRTPLAELVQREDEPLEERILSEVVPLAVFAMKDSSAAVWRLLLSGDDEPAALSFSRQRAQKLRDEGCAEARTFFRQAAAGCRDATANRNRRFSGTG